MANVNMVWCSHCGAVIESTHRHDFKFCECPLGSKTRVGVDGGSDYVRRAWDEGAAWVDVDRWEWMPDGLFPVV